MSRLSRRSTRAAQERPSSFEARDIVDDRLARFSEPLDYPARPISDVPELDDQYDYLIRTGLNDSESFAGRPDLGRPSSLNQVRATLRSRVVGRDLSEVIEGRQLAERAMACARRVVRKEVLFALRRTGRGSGARFRVRGKDSKYGC